MNRHFVNSRGALAAVLLTVMQVAHAAGRGCSADPSTSRLEFIGIQAGAEFKGTFHHLTANLLFSPEALGAAALDVTIDLDSVDTKGKDRDKAMRAATYSMLRRIPLRIMSPPDSPRRRPATRPKEA